MTKKKDYNKLKMPFIYLMKLFQEKEDNIQYYCFTDIIRRSMKIREDGYKLNISKTKGVLIVAKARAKKLEEELREAKTININQKEQVLPIIVFSLKIYFR